MQRPSLALNIQSLLIIFLNSHDYQRRARQGWVFSPLFFILYSEKSFQNALEKAQGSIKVNRKITKIMYGDDTIIIARSPERLQRPMGAITERAMIHENEGPSVGHSVGTQQSV